MSEIELLQAEVRMTAMHAAISLYCCHRNARKEHDNEGGLTPGQVQELIAQLREIRDLLLQSALIPGPI